ncbi:hypothetical protein ID47_11310 [Candidatus Paracaedibacter acanthamoebae]|uniref:Uncharacterized protein n=2 Tax=Candidatus Odyssella acanthamoebae TaxID=91604 RepID=A0A077B2G4_9PROT|nr:hypothetical protein ID47_11310 [Candidatus Paracaedibacter acanthamoebae]
MSSVRASFVFAFAILASVGAVLLYLDHSDRFKLTTGKQGLYIFDKKTTATNFCDTYRCIGISPKFIMPKKVDIVQIPGVQVSSQIQQPTPTIASLMMPPQRQDPVPSPVPVKEPMPVPSQPPVVQPKDPPPQTAALSQPAKNKFHVVEDEDMGGFINAPDSSEDE